MDETHTHATAHLEEEPGSGLAITSLVTGILGLAGFCAPLGLVALGTGIPAWIGASKTPPTRGGKGFAIVGTITGGLSMISGTLGLALLAGIMLPAIGTARQAAQEARGAAMEARESMQVRQIALGLHAYAIDSDGALPPAGAPWRDLLIDGGYVPVEMFVSPRLEGAVTSEHGYFYLPAETHTFDTRRVLVYGNPGFSPDGTVAVAFHDGHVEVLEAAAFEELSAGFALPDGTAYVPHLDDAQP